MGLLTSAIKNGQWDLAAYAIVLAAVQNIPAGEIDAAKEKRTGRRGD